MNKQELIKTLEATLQELKREEQETDFEEIVFKNNRKKSYFEWYDKIADKELSNLCKESWDCETAKPDYNLHDINAAIYFGYVWDDTPQGSDFWSNIYNRTDLETNPYIISKWKPEYKQDYFIPDLKSPELYSILTYWGQAQDKILHETNQVCSTKEEAIEKAKKMLNAIKD